MSTATVSPSGSELPELQPSEASARSRRNRFAFKTIKADFVWRILNAAARIISIPIAIRLLGNDRYGLWLTVSALLTWLNLSHAGLGGGLVNEVARALGRNDRDSMKRFVSTGYVCFFALAALSFLLVLSVRHAAFINTFLGVQHSPALISEAQSVFFIAGVLFAITIVSNAIVPIIQGLQESFLYFIYSSAGTLGTLTVIGILSLSGASLATYTVGVGLPPLIAILCLTIYFLYFRHPYLKPKASLFEFSKLRSIMDYGGPLLIAQCCELLIYNSSNPLIASRLGVGAVPLYATTLSVLMTVVNACEGVSRAYLGAYCEAASRADWTWIRHTARRTQAITTAIMGAASLGFMLLGPWAIQLWAGKALIPSRALILAISTYCFVMLISHTNYVLLLGLGKVKVKAVCQIFVAAAHVFGFLALVPSLGLLALPIAGTFGYLGDILVSTVQSSSYLRKQLHQQAAA